MSDKPIFETPDIRHASLMIAIGKHFLGPEDGTGRLRFRFECSPEEAAAYFSADDRVSARLLFQAWRYFRRDRETDQVARR